MQDKPRKLDGRIRKASRAMLADTWRRGGIRSGGEREGLEDDKAGREGGGGQGILYHLHLADTFIPSDSGEVKK